MTITLAEGFTVEVSEETVEKDVNLKVYLYLAEVRKAIEVAKANPFDSKEYKDAVKVADKFSHGWNGEGGVCTGLLDYCFYNDEYRHLRKECYDVYCEMNAVEEFKYRERYENEFLEYERKNVDYAKGLWIGSLEDYDFYSDWSKDIYGRRKRWTVASRL